MADENLGYNLAMSVGDFTPSLQVGENAGKARIFNSRLGRFVQADTIVPGAGNPQAFNRYAYVLNNPVNFVDPSGHAQQCFRASGRGVTCGFRLLDSEQTLDEVILEVFEDGGSGANAGGGNSSAGEDLEDEAGGTTTSEDSGDDECLESLWWCGLEVINGDLGELGIAANYGGDGTANGGLNPTCWAVIEKSSPYFQLYMNWLQGLKDASIADRESNDFWLAIASALAGIAVTIGGGGLGIPETIGIAVVSSAAGYTISGALDVDHLPYALAANAMSTIAVERDRVLLIWNNLGEQNLLVCNTDWQNCTDTGPVYSAFTHSFLKIHQAMDENFNYR